MMPQMSDKLQFVAFHRLPAYTELWLRRTGISQSLCYKNDKLKFVGHFMTSGKRIILTTFGSYGDIHPYMAIAMELQARGHHPVIATSELYREKMQAPVLSLLP